MLERWAPKRDQNNLHASHSSLWPFPPYFKYAGGDNLKHPTWLFRLCCVVTWFPPVCNIPIREIWFCFLITYFGLTYSCNINMLQQPAGEMFGIATNWQHNSQMSCHIPLIQLYQQISLNILGRDTSVVMDIRRHNKNWDCFFKESFFFWYLPRRKKDFIQYLENIH